MSYPGSERSELKLPYVTITTLLEYTPYKMTLGFEKDYRAHCNTSFTLSMAWTASTGVDQGRGLPSFLPPAWTGLQN
jgi:hypothetical protein